MSARWRPAGLAIAVCGLGACAAPPAAVVAPSDAATRSATVASMTTVARSLVGHGRDDVLAALGPATVIQLDSGHEIWVYRFVEPTPRAPTPRGQGAASRDGTAGDDAPSELVVLLDPSRVVVKFRVRSRTD